MASNPPSRDIAQVIEDNSYGTFATDLFIGLMPDNPDACISILDYSGEGPNSLIDKVDNPRVQVRVRGNQFTYATTFALIQNIYSALIGYSGTINSTHFLGIYPLTTPMFLETDEKNRPVFIVNLKCERSFT